MESLFGRYCSGRSFAHDKKMIAFTKSHGAGLSVSRHATYFTGDTQLPCFESIEAADSRNGHLAKRQRLLDPPTVAGTCLDNYHDKHISAIQTTLEVWPLKSNASLNPSQLSSESSLVTNKEVNQNQELFDHGVVSPFCSTLRNEIVVCTDSPMFQCHWKTCCEAFPFVSLMRRHVVEKHLLADKWRERNSFHCRWTTCPGFKSTHFSSREAWDDHMDASHYFPQLSPDVQVLPLASNVKTRGPRDQRGETDDAYSTAPYEADSDLECNSKYIRNDTQTSLPDSSFESQHSLEPENKSSQSKLENRREAYLAATKNDGKYWASYSLISASHIDLNRELELL